MLQGSLDNVSLDEVLGFLASSSKSGVLRISGDRGTGSVWVTDGQMVAADTTQGGAGATFHEVVFELLRFTSGSFAFDFDETNASPGSPTQIEGVLAQANKLLVEWRAIETVIPGLDYRITPAPNLPADQVTITEDEWTTILAVGTSSRVEEVASRLHLGQLEGLRRMKGLVERKLIFISQPHTEHLPSETQMDSSADAPTGLDSDDGETLGFEAPVNSGNTKSAPAVPPPVAPSARRLSARRAAAEPISQIEDNSETEAPSARSAAVPPPPAAPVPAPQTDNLSDPFAADEVRPPMPPPPPMSVASTDEATVGADVPPPPSPPSPAEIAKFGTSVEDASSISEDAGSDVEGETSLLMRYLQSEG